MYFFYERPTNEELISYYRSQYSSQHQQQLFQTLNESYNSGFFKGETQNHLYYLNMPATKVLDFGSSYGFYLKAMKELGIEVYGIEYDKQIVEYNERELGITMIDPGDLNSLESSSFDIVRIYHTLEHLPDPHSILSTFFRILKINGILLVSSPCLSDAIVQTNVPKLPDMVYPEHLFYFTTRAMSELLTRTGYRIEVNISQFASPSQALALLGIKGDFDSNTLEHIVKGLEGMGAGMNSFVVARKTSSDTTRPVPAKYDKTVCIYSLQKGQRGSHHLIRQDGLWKKEFPIKRSSHGGRIFVSGNIIVLRAVHDMRIQLINSSNDQPETNEISTLKNNEMRSFVFYNDVNGKDDYYIRICGTNASEFILYDLNCTEISFV
ncbi:MAG: class I SAM-dependent methyltransferase [Candidatus Nitrosopolaris sp.]